MLAGARKVLGTVGLDVAADQAERLRGQATTLGPGELTRAAEVLAVVAALSMATPPTLSFSSRTMRSASFGPTPLA